MALELKTSGFEGSDGVFRRFVRGPEAVAASGSHTMSPFAAEYNPE